VLFAEPVERIRAEAENGWFGIRPRHVDFVTALRPGVLTFQPCGRPEEYLAIDHGILVKCGPEVTVSTRNAVRGASLPALKGNVETQLRERREREKQARVLEAKLEADLVRHLLEAEKNA
jgi:F-type H+-transporting ATPase subunit epsilon